MSTNLKRSNAPIFWLLFGAGGMLSALLGPMLVFITGVAIPLGLIFAPDAFSYAHMQAFAQHLLGKAFILAVIALFLWHAGHRIFHSLHDVGIHAGIAAKAFCYGIPLLATFVTLVITLVVL
ncbi:MAG: fumarate reductase subunit FrdD [Rhodocyclaceae bacterium]|nr:fumarate reductase subunit FrdD [Rhodocyclaceae bacterium]